MAKPRQTQPTLKTVGWDALWEDLFGINLRSLRSVATIFINPKIYFKAAYSRNWEDRFTPSLRIWLALLALMSFLKVLFLEDSLQDPKSITKLAEYYLNIDPKESAAVAVKAAKFHVLTDPVCTIAVFILLAVVLRFWGQKTTFIVRLRLVSIAAVLMALLGIGTALAEQFVPSSYVEDWLPVYGASMLALIYITYFRGAFFGAKSGRLVRAFITASLIIAGVFASSIAAQSLSIYLATL